MTGLALGTKVGLEGGEGGRGGRGGGKTHFDGLDGH